MKITIIALCFFLALTSIQAAFTPEWYTSDSTDPFRTWRTLNVTLDAAPIPGKNSTFTLCGQSQTRGFRPKTLTVTSAVLDLTFPEHGKIGYEESHCFDVTFEIPQGPRDLHLHFALNSLVQPGAGGADVYLYLNHHHKFLRHSF